MKKKVKEGAASEQQSKVVTLTREQKICGEVKDEVTAVFRHLGFGPGNPHLNIDGTLSGGKVQKMYFEELNKIIDQVTRSRIRLKLREDGFYDYVEKHLTYGIGGPLDDNKFNGDDCRKVVELLQSAQPVSPDEGPTDPKTEDTETKGNK